MDEQYHRESKPEKYHDEDHSTDEEDEDEDEEEEERWIKHYSSKQRILLIGDGDFSFSLALARAFGSARNMVATSLDSLGELEFYSFAFPWNLEWMG